MADEENSTWDLARERILQQILAGASPLNTLRLAEAYAWLTQPNNAHGTSVSSGT